MNRETSPAGPKHQVVDDRNWALRPKKFTEFIGQQKVKDHLGVYVDAATKRQEPLDHVLLFGPPGLGKTTLAQIIANELGVRFRATSGPVIAKAGDLAAILSNLEEREVLFIDEIHRLSPQIEEILYPAIEDFALDLIVGEGPAARSIRIKIRPFTLVGATTRAGLLANPLRDRFGIPTRLDFYDPKSLSIIIMAAAHKIQVNIHSEGAMEIAKRARGTPRIAIRLLRRVRDFAEIDGTIIDKTSADKALAQLDISEDGLDSLDKSYLNALVNTYSGGPVGLDTLAAVISESRDTVEDVIEPYLMQRGMITRTPKGRVATNIAYERVGLSPHRKINVSQLDLGVDE